MRDVETILAEFDDPVNGMTDMPDSSVSSVRGRLTLEVLLDMRELLGEIKDGIDECKEELVEIKNNTA